MSKRTLGSKAKFGGEMTLSELKAFVEDAWSEDYSPLCKVSIRNSWRGGIKSIMVDDSKLVKQTLGPNPDPDSIQPS